MNEAIRKQALVVKTLRAKDDKLIEKLADHPDKPEIAQDVKTNRNALSIQTAMLATLVIKFLEQDGQL